MKRRPVWHQFARAEATGAQGRAGIGWAECNCAHCDHRFQYVAEGVLKPEEVIHA